MNSAQINEGLSDIVFHSTTIKNAVSILKNNQFNLTSTFHSPFARDFRPELYVMSFARSTINDFLSAHNKSLSITFSIDGRKLSYNYKAKPINYFHDIYKKNNHKSYYPDETEDKIYSYKPIISNAKKYIKEIHAFVREHADTEDFWGLDFIKKTGIPFYVYTSKKDYLLQNKKNSIPLESVSPHVPREKLYTPKKENRLKKWTDLINYVDGDINDLSPDSIIILKRVFKKENIKDKIEDLAHKLYMDFRQEKTNHENNHEFHMIVKMYNLNDLQDFVKLLIKNWQNFRYGSDGKPSKYLDPDILLALGDRL